MAAAANLTPPSCLVLFHYDVANNETMCDQCKTRSYQQVEAEDLGEGGYQKNTSKQVSQSREASSFENHEKTSDSGCF
jgi:hypothetical protein